MSGVGVVRRREVSTGPETVTPGDRRSLSFGEFRRLRPARSRSHRSVVTGPGPKDPSGVVWCQGESGSEGEVHRSRHDCRHEDQGRTTEGTTSTEVYEGGRKVRTVQVFPEET